MAQSSLASLAPLAFSDGTVGPSSPPCARQSVDINTASADLLRKSVPKVGAVLAQRIVEFREQNGPFKSVDDLMHVPGIGRRLAESLVPPATTESGIVNVRHATLPPPWGAPTGTSLNAAADEALTSTQETTAATTENLDDPSSGASTPARRPRTGPVKTIALAVAVLAGLVIGIWANTQSVKKPARELSERIDVTRVENEQTRAELERQRAEILRTQDDVKALSSRVETESTERKADHARVSRDVSVLHDTVKKANQSNEARIQRLRETLTEIELYHGANIAHPTGAK